MTARKIATYANVPSLRCYPIVTVSSVQAAARPTRTRRRRAGTRRGSRRRRRRRGRRDERVGEDGETILFATPSTVYPVARELAAAAPAGRRDRDRRGARQREERELGAAERRQQRFAARARSPVTCAERGHRRHRQRVRVEDGAPHRAEAVYDTTCLPNTSLAQIERKYAPTHRYAAAPSSKKGAVGGDVASGGAEDAEQREQRARRRPRPPQRQPLQRAHEERPARAADDQRLDSTILQR